MNVVFRLARAVLNFMFFVLCVFVLLNYNTAIYLFYQAAGQLSVLRNTKAISDYRSTLTDRQKRNLDLVEEIKQYSVDSLGYTPTDNYTRIFDQESSVTLWVITACKPYNFEAYTWRFPLVGEVSYKGFFKKELAQKEYHHLVAQGYDVDLRPVSAWSTLGWFSDPLLTGMLNRGKGSLCNLLFHELFHATYYAPSSVDLNENLASFIAHKATLRFLKNDSAALHDYLRNKADNEVFSNYMLRKKSWLESYYHTIRHRPDKYELKLKALYTSADSIRLLPLNDKEKFVSRSAEILKFKNAYFVDFQQYESLQDTLEEVFNKIYKGDIKIFIERLKLNEINY